MTLIQKISGIAGVALATASAGAFLSYSNAPVLSLSKEVEKEQKVEKKPKVKQYEYASDFFTWPNCCDNAGSGSDCANSCSNPMEIF